MSVKGEPTHRFMFFSLHPDNDNKPEAHRGKDNEKVEHSFTLTYDTSEIDGVFVGQRNLYFSVRYTCCSLQSLPPSFSYRVIAIEPAKDFRYHQGQRK